MRSAEFHQLTQQIVVATAEVLSGGLEPGKGFLSTEGTLSSFVDTPSNTADALAIDLQLQADKLSALNHNSVSDFNTWATAPVNSTTFGTSASPEPSVDLSGLFNPQVGNTLNILRAEGLGEVINGILDIVSIESTNTRTQAVGFEAPSDANSSALPDAAAGLLNIVNTLTPTNPAGDIGIGDTLQVDKDSLLITLGGPYSPVSVKVEIDNPGSLKLLSALDL